MKRAVVATLLTLALAACTSPLNDGAFQDIPDARADRVTARVGEPVEVTVTGGFIADEEYYLEEFVQPGVSLGACLWYTSDRTARGGICSRYEQPLPDGLDTTEGTTIVKNFGDIVVGRGEHRKIGHTFSFTSDQPGEVMIEPNYQFSYCCGEEPITEPGEGIRITFEQP